MTRLGKFLRLPPAERRLLVGATLLVIAIRLGLSLLPFPTLRRWLARAASAPAGGERTARPSVERLAWAVTVGSRYVPAATCLTQALAAQTLLVRHGHPASLRIGVARGAGGQFEAHAWVESQGRLVIGGAGSERFVPLPALDGERW